MRLEIHECDPEPADCPRPAAAQDTCLLSWKSSSLSKGSELDLRCMLLGSHVFFSVEFSVSV